MSRGSDETRQTGDGSEGRAELLRLKAAVHDPNTDLRALPAVMESIRGLFQRTRSIGIVHLEIDPSSRVEAVYGWQVLDDVLRAVSDELTGLGGESGETIVCQAGVSIDRFLLFAPVARPAAEAALDDIVSTVRERLEARLSGEEFRSMTPTPTVAIGSSIVSEHPFFRLERQIYRGIDDARRAGAKSGARERDVMHGELKRIVCDQLIDTLFQPIVDLENGAVIGYEAFSRGPRHSMLESPDALFETSRDAGMASELDRLCQRRAIRRARHLTAGTKLFLNALPDSLLDPGFREGLLGDLPEDFPVARGDIVLEIADRNSIEDYETFGSEVDDLRACGFRMSIDDVGKGSTSLESLSEVRPDFIKVDMSLIRNLHRNLIKQELLRSLCQVARTMNALVVAEGIETPEEREAAKRCGANLGQGYLFSRPLREIPPGSGTAERAGM